MKVRDLIKMLTENSIDEDFDLEIRVLKRIPEHTFPASNSVWPSTTEEKEITEIDVDRSVCEKTATLIIKIK